MTEELAKRSMAEKSIYSGLLRRFAQDPPIRVTRLGPMPREKARTIYRDVCGGAAAMELATIAADVIWRVIPDKSDRSRAYLIAILRPSVWYAAKGWPVYRVRIVSGAHVIRDQRFCSLAKAQRFAAYHCNRDTSATSEIVELSPARRA